MCKNGALYCRLNSIAMNAHKIARPAAGAYGGMVRYIAG